MSEIEYRIGLDESQLTTGLSRAQAAVRQANGRMQSEFAGMQSAIGSAAAGVAGLAAAFGAMAGLSVSRAVSELADLDDAAEKTGSSVETLSAAVNTLRAADAGGLTELLELTSRWGRALQSVDRDTSKSGEALKRLGLDIDKLKTMGRADAILEIARAQAKFADDGDKAVVIEAALGRGAASLIPQLNELAKTTREAGTATTQQASQAESAKKQLAAMQAQAIAFRNDLVAKILPAFNDFAVKLRAFAEIGSAPRDLVASVFGDQAALQAQLAQRRAAVVELRRTQDAILAERARLPDTDNAMPARRNVETRLAANNRALEQEGLRLNQLEALLKRRGELEAKYGLGDQPSAPEKPSASSSGLTGDAGGGKKSTPLGNFVDANTEALQELGKLFEQVGVTVAAKQQDLVQRLDKMFFDGLIGPELYEGAMRKLLSVTASVGKDGVGELDKKLEQQAEQWRDVIEPMRKYTRQLEEIRNLVKEGKLTPSQGIDAEFAVESQRQDSMDKMGKDPSARPEWLGALEGGFQQLFRSIQQGSVTTRGVFVGALEMMGSSLTGVLARMSAEWIAAELGLTGVKAAQAGVRAGIDASSAATSVATNAGAASTNIMISAWEAMAGAYKAIVGIPYVGPVLAPAAAAGAFGVVAALANRVTASAAGGYDIPGSVNPVTQLHAREMVLPAKHADVIRSLADTGAAPARGGSRPVNVNIHATDAQSVGRLFQDNRGELVRVIRRAVRDGALQ